MERTFWPLLSVKVVEKIADAPGTVGDGDAVMIGGVSEGCPHARASLPPGFPCGYFFPAHQSERWFFAQRIDVRLLNTCCVAEIATLCCRMFVVRSLNGSPAAGHGDNNWPAEILSDPVHQTDW